MTPEIKKCADNLLIHSVTLKNLYVHLHDDINPEDFDDRYLENSQELKGLKMFKSLKIDDDKWIYKLHTVIGIRFLPDEKPDEDLDEKEPLDEKESNESVEPVLEIKSEFVAQYESNCELSEDEINQFGLKHVFYHVWPYWREVIQSSCARLGVTPIIISPLRV